MSPEPYADLRCALHDLFLDAIATAYPCGSVSGGGPPLVVGNVFGPDAFASRGLQACFFF